MKSKFDYMQGEFLLSSHPATVTLADYDRARQWLVDYVSYRSDVIALVEYGSVRTPGLSDLDLIVVLANRPAPDIASYLDKRHFPDDVVRIMDGATLMVMSETDFPEIVRWDDVKLQCRYGRQPDVVRIEGSALYYTECCRIIDWLPWLTARLTQLIIAKRIPVRRTIGLLYSSTYSLRQMRTVFGLSMPRWEQYLQGVEALRNRWFDDPGASTEALLRMVHEGHEVMCEALKVFGDCLVKTEWYGSTDDLEGYMSVPGVARAHFTTDPQYISAKTILEDSSETRIIIHLPGLFFRHFASYALHGDGPISLEICKALDPEPTSIIASPVAEELKNILKSRIGLCDRWASFLRANYFTSGLFKFAWFYQ